MRVRDRSVISRRLDENDLTMAWLARRAEVSRQFIRMLANGEKTTCSERVGHLIAEALAVPVGDIFDVRESTPTRQTVHRKRTRKVTVSRSGSSGNAA